MADSLPQPPFFLVPNINNLRDAALHSSGLPTTSPIGRVRPGVLYRSAEVSKLDRKGWRKVREVGVAHVFDLRSKPEVDKGWAGITGDAGTDDVRPGWITAMEEEGVNRTWVPVFEESDYSPERLAERYSKYMGESVQGFVHAYQDILTNAGPSFRTILLYLANLPPSKSAVPGSTTFLSNNPKAPTPETNDEQKIGALIHCTAGKDRTGIFFGLLFSFLGVAPEHIAAEYNLTELGLANIREEVVGRLMLSPGFKKYMSAQMNGRTLSTDELAELIKQQRRDEADGKVDKGEMEENSIPPEVLEKGRQAALRMVGASKESMFHSLQMLEREFGGPEAYMRKVCGLQDEHLEGLRRNLVVPA